MPPADDVDSTDGTDNADGADSTGEPGRRARRGVRQWVRAAGKGTGRGLRKVTPYGTYAFLTAAAVAPVAGAALGGTDAFASALDQLGGMGGNYLASVLADTADRMRRKGIEPTGDQWRDAVAEELRNRLESSGEETLRLREEVGQVLRAVDGVGAALSESAEHAHELHQELIGAIAVLGNDFDEFRWMLTDLKQALAESTRTLGDVQRELLLARTEQREQSDVTHRFLVAVTKVRQWLKPEQHTTAPPADGPCPYPGLTSFRAGDAEWFHGRENAVAEVLARLAERLDSPGPLVVVGASGAGKSSLLHAGLLPALAGGGLPAAGSAGWPQLVLTPGANPVAELAARVATLAGVSAVAAARDLRAAPAEFGALTRQAALATGEARLVLVVDQFEELFTQCADPAERLAFATALANAGPALVVLAVRADFYEQCTRLEPLAPALPDQFVLGPMTPAELHRVVTEPAAKAGLVVEAGLAERLVADLGVREGVDYDPGALPLLAHALLATWRNRSGKTLTAQGYSETGGIENAVSGTAERIVGALGGAEREALRLTLLRMVTVVDGGGAVRRRVSHNEADLTVLAPLIEARLVTADQDGAQISHEALLTAWPRLRTWVAEDRQGLLVRQQLDEAVRYWTDNGRDDGALFRGLRLASAQEWAGPRTDLTEAEREFLRASERAQQRSTRRLRGLVAALAVLLVAALTAGVLALVARNDAERDRLDALSRQYAAESRQTADAAPGESMRKALAAWQTAPTTEARSALLSASTLTYPASFDSGLGTANAADLSPNGEFAAVGGPDGKVVVWDLRANRPLPAEFGGHTEAVDDVEFSPDGSLLATTSAETYGVRIWEVPSGRPVRTLPGVFRLAWRPDGRELAAIGPSLDLPVVGWDPLSGQEVRRLPGDRALVHDLAFSADGRLAVARNGGGVELWRTEDSTLVTRLDAHPGEGGMRVAFAPGVLATSRQNDTAIRLWDGETGAPLDKIQVGGGSGPGSLVFSPDGLRLLAGVGAEIQRWDMTTGQRIPNQVWDPDPIADLAVSADGRTVAAAAVTGKVTRWQRNTSWYTRPSGSVISLAFAPDGRTAAASDGDHAVHLWDPATGEQREQLTSADGPVNVLRYTPDGTRVEAARDGVVRVTPPGGGAPRTVTIPGRELSGDLVVSPDGALIAVASDDHRIHLFDTATLTERKVLELGEANAYTMVFTPDGASLVASTATNDDGTTSAALRSWRTTDFGEAWSAPLGPDLVTGLAISPDGRTLAIGDRTQIRLHDPADGRFLRDFGTPHPAVIRDLVFSPDGQTLAAGTTADPAVRLWNVADGSLLAVAEGLAGPPNDLAFTPDGTALAAGGLDTDVVLWRTRPEDSLAEVCRNLADGGAADLAALGCR